MAEFLHHEPCRNPECGSSDGLAVYDDGTGYCYVCETFFKADGEANTQPLAESSDPFTQLIADLEYIPLTKRKLSAEVCKKYGYGVQTYRGERCHVAPYRKGGFITAQHIRTPNKDFAWIGDSKEIELFGQHLFRTNGKRVIITEGEIDCMSVSMALGMKWAVVSLPSGASSARKHIKHNLEWLEGYQEVVLCFDNDVAGREAIEKCAPLFSPNKVRVVSLPDIYKDANDMLVDGKVAELVEALWEARTYRPDGIVAGTDLRDTILERFHKGVVEGDHTGLPLFDAMTRGLHAGKLLVLTAGSGIGKSTLGNELMYILSQQYNKTVALVALEENLVESSMRQMSIYLDKPLHLDMEGITEEAWTEAYDRTIGNGRTYLYDHFGSLEADNLMSKLRYLIVACGVDTILLDHISIVVSGGLEADERKAIDALMTNLRSLVENTGAGLIVVSHLKRADGKSKSHEEGGRITLGQLRGSGAIAQLSDFVIGLERDQQVEGIEKNVVALRILKNRHTGMLGLADYLLYSPETGRLTLYEPPPFEDGPHDNNSDF